MPVPNRLLLARVVELEGENEVLRRDRKELASHYRDEHDAKDMATREMQLELEAQRVSMAVLWSARGRWKIRSLTVRWASTDGL
jgi:hypothetical protein